MVTLLQKWKMSTILGAASGQHEEDIQIRIAKAWSALNSMQEIWKSKMPDKLKRHFFQSGS